MTSWIIGLAIVLVACLGHERATAACVPRLEIVLADGSRVCLSDHPLADLRPSGHGSTLKDLLPSSGSYTLAMPGAVAACPAVAGFMRSSSSAVQSVPAGDSREHRAVRALDDCNSAARASGGSAECGCTLVVVDGHSPLRASEFAERARVAPAVRSSQATNNAAAPSSSTAANGAPASGTNGPVAAVGPSAADIAALRQQIESLQTQMSRQSAAPTQPPVAARPAAPRLRARALVVGNGAYGSLGPLGNPRKDAEAIADRLRKFGVEVDLVLDASRSALVKALADYQTRAAGYDVNILFYAGHGLQIGGTNYLVPVDLPAAGATIGSVKLNALSLNDVLEYLSAPTRVVFLDACRDNPLSRSLLASRSAAAGVGLAPVNTTSGTLVAYATKDGSTAEDGTGRNSPYTSALLQHLDAEEDIAVVLRRVRQAVLKATNGRQEPWEYGSLIGDQLVLSRLGR